MFIKHNSSLYDFFFVLGYIPDANDGYEHEKILGGKIPHFEADLKLHDDLGLHDDLTSHRVRRMLLLN